MNLTGFLMIPDIAGESQRQDHEGEIDFHNLDWGIAYEQPAQVGRGRSRARTEVSDLSVSKYFDASSPYLALASMRGKAFDEVVISLRKDSGEAHLDYLVITMTNVLISSYDILRSSGELGQIEERVSFSFEKVAIKYTVQADDHSAGDEHEIEYDIAAGV